MDSSFIENIPFGAPPAGQSSNFDNPDTRGPAVVVVCSVFIAFMWPFLLLRLYSKVWVIKSFGWDDGKLSLRVPFRCLLIYDNSVRHACSGKSLHTEIRKGLLFNVDEGGRNSVRRMYYLVYVTLTAMIFDRD